MGQNIDPAIVALWNNLSPEQKHEFREARRKRLMLASFPFFMETALKRTNPNYGLSKGHRFFCDKLQLVADGHIPKLMAFCPSGWGKTSILRGFQAWVMIREPGIQLIGASHNGEFAENKVSRPVQDLLREFDADLGVHPVDENKKEWRTNNGSSYRAAGVGAGILGERMKGGVIDDPFGNIKDAKSPVIRDAVYEWYRGDWTSRFFLDRPTWQVLMHQRLHLDDLAGRLLEEEGDSWDVVFLPARFEGVDHRGQPIAEDCLGRSVIGESVWPESWTDEALTIRQAQAGPYAWASMYQQRPVPPGGTTFLPTRLVQIENEADLLPAKRIVMACDYAAAKTKGDYTACVLMQENDTHLGGWTILDVIRKQGGPDIMERLIVDTAARHAKKYGQTGFKIFLPQDGAAGGAYMVSNLTKALAGYIVDKARESGDKELRATPFASQVNVGNVSMLVGPWNKAFKEELENFPHGNNDDMVDAASSAFNQLIPEPVYVPEPVWTHEPIMMR